MKEFIEIIVRESGKIAMKYLGRAEKYQKSKKDFATEADIAVEKYLVSKIHEKYPEHNIVGEEDSYEKTDSEYTWYIDPIDGTANYMHSDIHFAVSLGLKKGTSMQYAAVYLPMINEFYYAEKGKGAFLNNKKIQVSKVSNLKEAYIQASISPLKKTIDNSLKHFRELMLNGFRARDLGFCAGQLAFVAAGRSDALVKTTQNPWDFAAGILLIEEAGGKVTDEHGKEIIPGDKNSRQNIVASNNKLHDELLALINSEEMKKIDTKTPWW